MSDKQTVFAGAPARGHIDGRLVAAAMILVILAFEVGLIRLFGPIGPPALDPETLLVGP